MNAKGWEIVAGSAVLLLAGGAAYGWWMFRSIAGAGMRGK